MSMSVPESSLTTEELARLSGFDRPTADALDEAIGGLDIVFTATVPGFAPASGGGTVNFLRADGTWSAPPGDGLSVKNYGTDGAYDPVTGTGGVNDQTAFEAVIAAALAAGANQKVLIPPGNYKLTRRVLVQNARGLHIEASAFSTLYYPSDDLSLMPVAGESYPQRRSGFLLKNCRNITFDGIEFVGGDTPETSNANVGHAIYASRCRGLRVNNCRSRLGASLFAQEAAPNSGDTTNNAITVSGGIVTLTNTNALFNDNMRGMFITVVRAVNLVNDGVYEIIDVPSSTQVCYRNASAVAESAPGSTVIWSVDDGDDDTKLDNCRWDNNRAVSYTGSGGTYVNCTFTRPMTPDLCGIHDSFSVSGTTVTISDATGTWSSSVAGRYIKVSGSTSAANDGLFLITAATKRNGNVPATLTYTNASGVAEFANNGSSKWWIAGGERSGIGAGASAISSSSGVVTFTALTSIFRADDVGKTIGLTDATTPTNNGNRVITRFISATQIQYIQSGAVSETYSKVFTIDGYDSTPADSAVGPFISSASTSVAANTLADTGLAMVVNAYAGRYLADSTGRQWMVSSNTATAFTLAASGATPTAGAYTVSSGATHGSTHGIYIFAGRSNIVIDSCTFRGMRTMGIKISGSSLPIHDVEIKGCTFEECGAAIIGGADDAQDHTNLNFHDNKVIDCALGRVGWNFNVGIWVLGARGVSICNNTFHASHDAVPVHVNTLSAAGLFGIVATRYLPGVSQPLEDVAIDGNVFTSNAAGSRAARIATSAINAVRVGQRAKWGNNGTLTKVGNVMTLADGTANFSPNDVSSTIQICFAPNAGNNSTATLENKVVEFIVTSVPSTSLLTFTNAGGVGGGVSAGTYRIKPQTTRGGACSIRNNNINAYGRAGINISACTAPLITGNVFNGLDSNLVDDGSVALMFANNVEVQTTTNNARISLTTGTSWPTVYNNFVTNGALNGGNLTSENAATRSDMGISVNGTASVDYPLRGVAGRALPANAKPENVFAFGYDLVDGDTFAYNGTVYTYKTTSPTGNQFNSLAGLIALLDARGGEDCKDYGAWFATPVATGHIRIRSTAPGSTVNSSYIDTINVLNPTALIIPRDAVAGGEAIQYSRGEGAAGPVADKGVVWSAQAMKCGAVVLVADNDAAITLLASGYRPLKDANNAGCCEVIKLPGTQTGAEEFRWVIV